MLCLTLCGIINDLIKDKIFRLMQIPLKRLILTFLIYITAFHQGAGQDSLFDPSAEAKSLSANAYEA